MLRTRNNLVNTICGNVNDVKDISNVIVNYMHIDNFWENKGEIIKITDSLKLLPRIGETLHWIDDNHFYHKDDDDNYCIYNIGRNGLITLLYKNIELDKLGIEKVHSFILLDDIIIVAGYKKNKNIVIAKYDCKTHSAHYEIGFSTIEQIKLVAKTNDNIIIVLETDLYIYDYCFGRCTSKLTKVYKYDNVIMIDNNTIVVGLKDHLYIMDLIDFKRKIFDIPELRNMEMKYDYNSETIVYHDAKTCVMYQMQSNYIYENVAFNEFNKTANQFKIYHNIIIATKKNSRNEIGKFIAYDLITRENKEITYCINVRCDSMSISPHGKHIILYGEMDNELNSDIFLVV